MSFFDEGDQPRRPPRPRRPAGGVTADPQTVRTRQGVAIAVGLLLFVLLVVGIDACRDSARKGGLREYNEEVSQLVARSDTEVGRPFFERLAAGGGQQEALDLEGQVNLLRELSGDLARQAAALEAPEAMAQAQTALELVLEMRRDALAKIAGKLPDAQATGPSAEDAIVEIAGQMQLFYASDLLYRYRVAPAMGSALEEAEVEGQDVQATNFFPTIEWLDSTKLAPRLGATISAGRRGGPVAPGSHGHGLTSVSVNGTALDSETANRIAAGASLSFNVRFQNQGENNENGVVVKVSIEGSGAPVTAQATLPQSSAGSEASVDVPLTNAPPINQPVQINVSVEPVPGEEKTDNNRQSFPALFTQG